ncbi:type II toxin-antitoxin system VapC family toxin [Dyadobacter aurulentus]|uniref:type II toxin-antitoxin system VapC family toxin n=1 Tax=Dyadobacter sp. UC 10 TaxID=2605428 RepID=UPI0011F20A0A|nr:type II toxin-antitoxin system VapC family toxin [Dyadobacter sp. UC 10]KAA0990678.1 type II toxin-antitoxin system VapC family toxin [Dyadobacter sp. UC 10]
MQRRYLIDTQVLIWALISPEMLSQKVREILSEHLIYVSRISLLEIAIKQKLDKLPMLKVNVEDLENRLVQDGFQIMHLKTSHIAGYDVIPFFPIHQDPFDRILLATAFAESIPIISSDQNFKLYSAILRVIS